MGATPETLDRFIFNSDFPIDKVVWLYEGQTTSPSSAGATNYTVINLEDITGEKEPLFVKGIYTVDNWTTSYMMGTNIVTSDPNKNVTMGVTWYKDYNDHKAKLDIGISSRTMYSVSLPVAYRLYGLAREDTRSAASYTKNASTMKNKLVFNTDNNYPRLFKDGIAKSGDVIEHNLNKIPYVDYWLCNSALTYISYDPYGKFENNETHASIRATDKTITFTQEEVILNGQTVKQDCWYYYRIYA